MIGGEIRVALNLGDVAIREMNQHSATAMAGATVSLDNLLSGRFMHRAMALSQT